jgi:hypothetical protein
LNTLEKVLLGIGTGVFSIVAAKLIQPFDFPIINTLASSLSTSNSSSGMQSMNIEEILSHPFIVLIAGAILTGLLLPFLTNRWQSRQKDLELQLQLKLDLLKRINQSVTQTIMSSISAWSILSATSNGELRDKEQQERNSMYRKWEISSAEIESDIETYFPNTDMGKRWYEYSEVLSAFYFLTIMTSTPGTYTAF